MLYQVTILGKFSEVKVNFIDYDCKHNFYTDIIYNHPCKQANQTCEYTYGRHTRLPKFWTFHILNSLENNVFSVKWATSWETLFMPYANNKGAIWSASLLFDA